MVLIGRFFLSPGFLHAQDCKHQGDIGVANRPKKEAADVPARDEICRSSKFDYTRNPTEHLLEIIVHA